MDADAVRAVVHAHDPLAWVVVSPPHLYVESPKRYLCRYFSRPYVSRSAWPKIRAMLVALRPLLHDLTAVVDATLVVAVDDELVADLDGLFGPPDETA